MPPVSPVSQDAPCARSGLAIVARSSAARPRGPTRRRDPGAGDRPWQGKGAHGGSRSDGSREWLAFRKAARFQRVPLTTTPAAPQPRLLDQMREALRSRHYSPRTEQSYCRWVRRFVLFHEVRHPAEMAEPEINAFLTHLAVKEGVSALTQNQALSALLFLYRTGMWSAVKSGHRSRPGHPRPKARARTRGHGSRRGQGGTGATQR
jgi:hypothetical protein